MSKIWFLFGNEWIFNDLLVTCYNYWEIIDRFPRSKFSVRFSKVYGKPEIECKQGHKTSQSNGILFIAFIAFSISFTSDNKLNCKDQPSASPDRPHHPTTSQKMTNTVLAIPFDEFLLRKRGQNVLVDDISGLYIFVSVSFQVLLHYDVQKTANS